MVSSINDEVDIRLGMGGQEMSELKKSRAWARIWVQSAIVGAWCLFFAVALLYAIEVMK